MNELVPIEKQLAVPARRTVAAGASVSAIVPRDYDEAYKISRAICTAGMVPDSYKGKTEDETIAKVCMGVMKGLEVGLPPITALSNIYIVNNRPSLWGDAALALVQSNPEYFGCEETITGKADQDGYTATCTIKRKLPSGEVA